MHVSHHKIILGVKNTFKCNHKNLIFNTVALRKAKIVYNFGLSECNRVNIARYL